MGFINNTIEMFKCITVRDIVYLQLYFLTKPFSGLLSWLLNLLHKVFSNPEYERKALTKVSYEVMTRLREAGL